MEQSQQQEKNLDYSLIDPKLVPIAEMITSLSELEGAVEDEGWGLKMSIEEIEIEMPMEFDIMTDDLGNLVLGSAPPTQTIETSYMPVFHKVKLGIKILNAEEHG
ncbi:MAG: hypothetical protein ACOYXT_18515 [Bacteroidota bacterium]